ncbi:hypothetical protein VNO77_37040 [Canavalia gladiata]|uniref:Uncharacterized protein n=1 Tax=Canavalia gladiata TaxID=3824 RepID=A0AAN9KAF3_CANGL
MPRTTTTNPTHRSLIPQNPNDHLNFESYQSFLQRLGLWEIVHLEFDSVIRDDLLVQLIFSYLPKKTSAGFGAAVDGADLESIAFPEELVYSWMDANKELLEKDSVIEEEVDGSGDVKMTGVDGQVCELGEHHIELSLRHDNFEGVNVEKEQGGKEQQMMDFEQSKEEEPGMWLLDQKNSMAVSFLWSCQGSDVKGVDCGQIIEDEGEDRHGQEEKEEEDAEEDEHEGDFHLNRRVFLWRG